MPQVVLSIVLSLGLLLPTILMVTLRLLILLLSTLEVLLVSLTDSINLFQVIHLVIVSISLHLILTLLLHIVRWCLHQKFLLNMIVVEKLRLNRYKSVSIPSSKDMYLRMGLRSIPKVQDGLVADFSSTTMEQLDNLEAQVLKDVQMPLDTDV